MSTALALGVTGTGINAVHAISKGHDPFPVLIAGTLLTVLFVATEGNGVGVAAAAVYLLGAFIVNGTEIINIATALTDQKG